MLVNEELYNGGCEPVQLTLRSENNDDVDFLNAIEQFVRNDDLKLLEEYIRLRKNLIR